MQIVCTNVIRKEEDAPDGKVTCGCFIAVEAEGRVHCECGAEYDVSFSPVKKGDKADGGSTR